MTRADRRSLNLAVEEAMRQWSVDLISGKMSAEEYRRNVGSASLYVGLRLLGLDRVPAAMATVGAFALAQG